MEWLYVLVPFVLLGIGVIWLAYRSGAGAAGPPKPARGGRGFRLLMVLVYVALGLGVPAAIIAARDEAEGGVGPLEQKKLTAEAEEGKQLFRQTCASCHNLDAVNARGVTGPDLDDVGEVSEDRVLNAIENGGTGSGRMPANLLSEGDAEAVALYVSRVAGR
ncbi:MAG TPA: cytochrome c [Thermoleophilaceae bacterium]|nr:cytochrome c [Thermoleophilaceae bacterium]